MFQENVFKSKKIFLAPAKKESGEILFQKSVIFLNIKYHSKRPRYIFKNKYFGGKSTGHSLLITISKFR